MPSNFRYNNRSGRKGLVATIEEINHTLRCLAETGCRGFDCSEQSLNTVNNWSKKTGGCVEALRDIRRDLGDCERCRLSRGRKNIVFGTGNPMARLVFVGEGPGYEEDQRGEPFVGAAGQLLTKIILAIGHTRKDVYICNIIKCRPPGNRNPLPDEIRTCVPFLRRQLAAIKPDFICALGSIAAQTLLKTQTPISKLRGSFHQYMKIPVLPTYHPAFLLRNPDKKREVWEDMKQLMKALDQHAGQSSYEV
jgi:uracil-DNA glycosylase family 4